MTSSATATRYANIPESARLIYHQQTENLPHMCGLTSVKDGRKVRNDSCINCEEESETEMREQEVCSTLQLTNVQNPTR